MIKKVGEKWQVDIQLGGRGKNRYRNKFATRNEAKRFEVHLLSEFNQSKDWNGFASG